MKKILFIAETGTGRERFLFKNQLPNPFEDFIAVVYEGDIPYKLDGENITLFDENDIENLITKFSKLDFMANAFYFVGISESDISVAKKINKYLNI